MITLKASLLISIVVLISLQLSLCDDSDELELKCRQGKLRGTFLNTRGGREIRAFMSIPYIEPPVGDLRFQPPVPLTKWKGVLDATVIHDICPQRDVYTRSNVISGNEDCIYLNVYTPKKADITQPLPVMMFIHGGGYLCGAGNINWYGPGILLDRDVILVVPNYRLGAFGFISTGDDVFPGNNGMKDLSVALQWIKDNIEHFGGDPNLINVFGQSAGGAATHLMMMSPMSSHLIKTGISQSGTGLAPWTIAPRGEAKEHAHKLATMLKCPTSCSKAMLDCLKKIKPYRFIELDRHFMDWDFDPMIPFKPVVEHAHPGAFLTEHPEDIIKSGNMPNIPWMVGVTSSDGAIRAAAILVEQHLVDQINYDFDRIVPIATLYEKNVKDVDAVTKELRDLYFGTKNTSRATQQSLVNMFTDAWFFNNTDFSIHLHQKYVQNDIYLYKFSHRGVASYTAIFGDPVNDFGVCHADDLQYLFPVGDLLFPNKKPDEADKKMAKYMTTLWTNFARQGDPNLDDDKLSKWTKVTSDRLEHYHLEVPDKSYMDIDMFIERTRIWRALDNNNLFIKDEL